MNRAFQHTLKRWSIGAVLLASSILLISLLAPAFSPPTKAPGIPTNLPETGQISPTATNVEVIVTLPTLTETTAKPAFTPTGGQGAQTVCTYNQYYWLNHPEIWPTDNFIIDRVSYTKAEALAVLGSDSLDVTTLLLQQFFPAVLNTLQGADSSPINTALYAAGQWLSRHPLGTPVPPEDSPDAVTLTLELQAYNFGALGPWACPGQPSTPTPLPTATPSPTPTFTPTVRIYQLPPPTSHPEKPAQPTRAPSKTPLPGPTNTPPSPPTATRPPTQPPPTSPPRPTATPTVRPTPTLAPFA